MSALQILQDIAPEFVDENIDRLGRFIEYAKNETNDTAFGTRYDMAVALLAAHKLTIAGRDGMGGAISAIKEGEIMTEFVTSPDDKNLDTTAYGIELNALRKKCIVGAVNAWNPLKWPTLLIEI